MAKEMELPGERLWTVKEIASYYHCDRRTVYGWIESGMLKAIKPVNKYLVADSDLQVVDRLIKGGACVKDHAACVTLMRLEGSKRMMA